MGRFKLTLFISHFLVLSLSFSYVMASKSTDSLKLQLEKSGGTSRVDILNELSGELKHQEPDEALNYANDAISLAKTIDYKVGEANGHINTGNVYRKLGKFNDAIEEYLLALKLSQEADDPNTIARAFNGLGIANNLLGDYDKSLEGFLNALKTYEGDNNLRGTADALNNIGIHYWSLGVLDKALEHYLRALELRKEIGLNQDIAASLNNIGDIYADMGKTDSALYYLQEALKIQEKEGNSDLNFALQLNIGLLYAELENHEEAFNYYDQGLEIADNIGDDWGKAKTYNFIGISHLKLNDLNKAEQYFQKSLNLAININAKAAIKDAYQNLSELSRSQGDYQKSLEYYKLYTQTKDSIFNDNTSKQIAEINTRYETEKKEAEIKELTIEKTLQDLKLRKADNLKWFFIVASSLILMLLIGVFYGFRQKQKANQYLVERNKLEIENKNRAISLFGQQVSKEVALELLSHSAKSSSQKLFACIMFLDIRDFTPFAEKREPFEIIQYQNDVFGFMIDIIAKHHGIINQFLGDGFMATFGAPTSSGNDCQNAIDAAMEIIELLNKKCDSGEIPETKVGIGLHAGDIVTGNVGTAERKQYSITGNTVILASRIEALNKKFNSSILISKDVLDHVDRSKLKFEKLGAENLKGRAEPMEIIKLI